MNKEEQILWLKLLAFEFDEKGAAFPFVKRLARENGWTINYAERVVIEYKKFIFLCTISNVGITPSDSVDQAWHLHMIYTNSYWNKLCNETLNKQIHHNPTKGGKAENDKFNTFYDRTRELYKEKFGEDQPADIWQGNEERFSDIDFQRVNKKRSWIIPKPRIFVGHRLFAILIAMIGLSFVAMTDGEILAIIIGGAILGIFLLILLFNSGGKNKRNRGGGSSSSSSGCSSSSGGFFIFGCSSGSDSSSHSSGCGSSGCSSGCGSGCGGGGCGS